MPGIVSASVRSPIAVLTASARSAADWLAHRWDREPWPAPALRHCAARYRAQALIACVAPRSGRIAIVASSFVRAAHRAGLPLPVHVWTVNAESSMHELLDLGVDA